MRGSYLNEHVAELHVRYSNGESTASIAKDIGCTSGGIRDAFHRRGFAVRTTGESRRASSPSIAEKLESFTIPEPNSGCHLFLGGLTADGYGTIWVDGRKDGAHQVAYRLKYGDIPPGMHLDHLCRNPGCVNPDHLEPVTPRTNALRSRSQAAANAKRPIANTATRSMNRTPITAEMGVGRHSPATVASVLVSGCPFVGIYQSR